MIFSAMVKPSWSHPHSENLLQWKQIHTFTIEGCKKVHAVGGQVMLLLSEFWQWKYRCRLIQISSEYYGISMQRARVMLLSGGFWWWKHQYILMHIFSEYSGIKMQGGWGVLLSGKYRWCKYWYLLINISIEYRGIYMQGVRRWCYGAKIDAYWCIFQVNLVEYICTVTRLYHSRHSIRRTRLQQCAGAEWIGIDGGWLLRIWRNGWGGSSRNMGHLWRQYIIYGTWDKCYCNTTTTVHRWNGTSRGRGESGDIW